jgi:hypothetical protein
VVVKDLNAASERYQALGFTLKPGRLHADGIRNNHVKFPDGSGIELISPPATPLSARAESQSSADEHSFVPPTSANGLWLEFHKR